MKKKIKNPFSVSKKAIVLEILAFVLIGISLSCNTSDPGSSDMNKEVQSAIDHALDVSANQYKSMMTNLPDGVLPRTIDENGELITAGSEWWTSGFYPGSCWYLYELTGDGTFRDEAIKRLEIVEKEKYNTKTHDLGFMLYCSFGNGYRLTKSAEYQDIMITGANSLITRFNENVGCIKSWESNERWQFPVIIDNMMNLEFLFWATKVTGDSTYYKICTSHADTTMKYHFRDDYSSYHVLDYDTITGKVLAKNTAQGYSDESAWARGQAWGFYGYVVMYRETGDQKYLDQAIKIGDFMLNHENLPEDKIPYWDFNAPEIPDAYRDASAGAIICSALIELSEYVDDSLKQKYLNNAETMLLSLASDKYLAKPGTNGNFILKHSVGHKMANSEVDVPLTYADYYFLEAMLRYKHKNK